MYPYLRMVHAVWKARKAPPLGLFDSHESRHRIWPQDLDIFMELNNGRTLTLFDLGRVPMFMRMGWSRLVRTHGWTATVAGNTTRYRKRVTLFQVLTMRSRLLGWDDRFLYMEQSFWRGSDCTAATLIRSAVLAKGRILPPAEVAVALGQSPESPPLPDWVQAWIAGDATRVWPPKV